MNTGTKALPERIRYAADNKNYACLDGNCKARHDAEYVRADLFDVGAGIRIKRGAKNKRKLERDAAIAMRELCVEKVRAMGQQWYGEAKKRGAAFSDKGRLAEAIAKELESLTLHASTTKAEGQSTVKEESKIGVYNADLTAEEMDADIVTVEPDRYRSVDGAAWVDVEPAPTLDIKAEGR